MVSKGKKGPDDLQAYLYRLVSSRAYTEREAAEKLVQRGAERSEALDLAAGFAAMGLIDDEAYARLFADGHESWGNERIRFELRRRGVSDDKIAAALVDRDEEEAARFLAESWTAQGLEREKIAARLLRRGFSSRAVRKLGREETEW